METGRDTEEKRVGESSELMDEDGATIAYNIFFFSRATTRFFESNRSEKWHDVIAENPDRLSPSHLSVSVRDDRKTLKKKLQDASGCQGEW